MLLLTTAVIQKDQCESLEKTQKNYGKSMEKVWKGASQP
jgi:hypothetical protein